MPQPIEAVCVGAGNRGYRCFGGYATGHPEQIKFTAVVEPLEDRRKRFADTHKISPERQFASIEDFYAKDQLAQALVSAAQDRNHVETTMPAFAKGYDVLLEKPMANTLEGSVRLVQEAEKHGRLLMICHCLRYTDIFSAINKIIKSGRLGKIVSMEHRENATYWHMAHSFVRGNWRNSDIESPMILAKTCHDMDLIYWNMGPVKRLSSFGSLIHYRKENAPEGAPKRCLDGCPVEEQCPWSAIKQYLGPNTGWPVATIAIDMSIESRREAIATGPYGRCVFHCDNNVVDNQHVNMEFESGASGTMFLHGHSHEEGRTMRYDGTIATLRGKFSHGAGHSIEVHEHGTGKVETYKFGPGMGGHGGGDAGLIASFVKAVNNPANALTTGRESLESHLMSFSAEESRVNNGAVIEMSDYRKRCEEMARE
jgi:predicted dehydrogenase